jgi:hypothetical protein
VNIILPDTDACVFAYTATDLCRRKAPETPETIRQRAVERRAAERERVARIAEALATAHPESLAVSVESPAMSTLFVRAPRDLFVVDL